MAAWSPGPGAAILGTAADRRTSRMAGVEDPRASAGRRGRQTIRGFRKLKLGHKLFFRTSGALTRINCITIDHTAHKIRLAVDGFSRESSPQHTA